MNIYKLFCAPTINTTNKKNKKKRGKWFSVTNWKINVQANNNTHCKNFHPQMATKTQEQTISTTPHFNLQVYCFVTIIDIRVEGLFWVWNWCNHSTEIKLTPPWLLLKGSRVWNWCNHDESKVPNYFEFHPRLLQVNKMNIIN